MTITPPFGGGFRRGESSGTTATAPRERRKPQIRVAKSVYRRNLMKQVARIVGYTILVLFLIYLCFAATIIRAVPTKNMGVLPVKNATVPRDHLPKGTVLVMNTKNSKGRSMVDRLEQSFVPQENVVKAEVVAGPYGKLTWAAGVPLVVDGKLTPVKLSIKPSDAYLNKVYVVKCLEGACKPGEGLLVPADNVYGQPLEKKG